VGTLDTAPDVSPLPARLLSPRRAWLRSLVIPGSGQHYCGKTRRGLVTGLLCVPTFLSAVVLFFALWAGESSQATSWATALRVSLILYIFGFLDAYYSTREINAGTDPPPYANPRVAAVLNLLTRGFGYWYLGERKKGWIFFIALGLLFAGSWGLQSRTVVDAIFEVIMIGMAIDAYCIGRRQLAMGGGRASSDWPAMTTLGLGTVERTSLSVVASAPRLPEPPADLPAVVPLTMACFLALAYTSLGVIGLMMPSFQKIDQSRAKITEANGEKVYRNPRYGIEMPVPSAWQYDRSNLRLFAQANSLGGACNALILAEPLSPLFSLESRADLVVRQLLEQNQNYRLLGHNLSSLGGLPAHEIILSRTVDGNEIIQHYFLARQGLSMYSLVTTVNSRAAEACQADLVGIRQKLRIWK